MPHNETKTATAKPDTLIRDDAKKDALRDIVIFPVIMLVSYLLLIFYFRTKGGYKAVELKNELT